MPINPKTGKSYKLSKPSGPGSNYTGKLSQSPPPYADDVDIFEGGPAGQVLIDIDPTYGGIQLQEDEKIGDDAARDLAKVTKNILEFVSPSEETLKQQEDQRAKNQQILDFVINAAGLEPGSFEANKLLADLKMDKRFQENLGFDQGNILTGGGTTDSPTLGLYDMGNFFFGDARRGLTSMVDEGTKFKELPFEQKLGITILPIDLIDVAGLAYLAKTPIGVLMRAGQKAFGKGSKLTVKELANNKEFMQNYLKENPNAAEALEEYGIDIRDMTVEQQSKLGVGADINKNILKQGPVQPEIRQKPPNPKTKKEIEAEEIRKTAESLEGTFEGKQAQDPAPPRGAYPMTSLKNKIKNDPKFENEETLNDFIALYENRFNSDRAGPSEELYMKKGLGEETYEQLKELAKNKGIKIRNMGPQGKKLTPEGMKYLEENYKTSDAEELLNTLNSDKSKYFFTDKDGNFKGFTDLKTFTNYKNAQGFKGTPRIKEDVTKTALVKFDKAKTQFEKKIQEIQKAGQVELTPEVIAKEFEIAVRNAEGVGQSRLTAADAREFSYLYNRHIKRYNESLPEGSPLKVLNKTEIRSLKAGDIEGRTQIANKFSNELTQNEGFQEALNVLGRGNSETLKRYLNFIRESTSEVKGDVREFGNFIDSMIPRLKELQDPNSIFRKNYDYFKIVDNARDELGELSKPFLNKLFKTPAFAEIDGQKIIFDKDLFEPDTKAARSLQIAHRYEGDQIGQTLPKDLSGASEFPQSYTIDVSFINQGVQPKLEAQARNAVAAGDEEAMRKIHLDAERFGTAFEVDGVQFGTQKGIADKLEQYLQYVVRRPDLQEKFGITKQEILNMRQAIEKARALNTAGYNFAEGGLVREVDDIFEEEDELKRQTRSIFPKISVEFGDAARGTKRSFGEEKPEEQVFDIEQKTTAAPMQKTFDVQPTENIFTGEVEQANLKLPFWKLFTKPPVNETAPIPTPKESLDNPTKKQKESLELEKEKKKDDVFDPTPEDNDKVNLVDDVTGMDISVTPKTNQPITGVFYSDIERILSRPDTPKIFPNKQALLDFFRKNRIRDSEFRDYQIESLLRAYDDTTPIPTDQVIRHLRQSPIRGMHVHATGKGSEIINPYGEKSTAYSGYAEPGYIQGTQRERVLYIPKNKLAGDTGANPQGIFKGESVQNHEFGIPGDSYIVGWTRLTDRNAILPTKIAAPKSASNIPGLTRERERAQRQVAGLYAEAINKLNREGARRGFSQAELDELSQLSLEQIQSQYAETLNRLSPGLLDQMDELIVKVRDIDDQITKGSNIDTSGVVRVAFADEIQSDIMQAAAGRKQKLLATLRKISDEGRESTTLPELDRIGNQALAFFEENKSVFRPLAKSEAEVNVFAENLNKLDAEVDEIINRYIETREISDESIARLKNDLIDNIDTMINDLIQMDVSTYDGLFPDLPFKKREEWADALIKKDLFELAYRKFVLKEENVPDYYAVTPDKFVIDRYNFRGDSSTPMDVRAADKKRQIDIFSGRGEFVGSEYKGIGMSEFYGGPNAVTPDGKHYTSTIEKILKAQAKSNNSEFMVLNVQTKAGATDVFKITDQNGNMVATLSNRNQAETLINNNPNYRMERISVPTDKNTTPSFAIKITEEMLEPYKTHKAKGGFVEMIDIFEV